MKRRQLRRCAAVVAFVLVAPLFACGGRDEPETVADADPFEQPLASSPIDRAGPRWESVTILSGSGSATKTVAVSEGAIQWRVKWKCDSGPFAVDVSPAAADEPLVDAACPQRGTAVWVGDGEFSLKVGAEGAWEMRVEQQVDSPLVEPPLASMTSTRAKVIARGRFYPIERRGKGFALLYRLPQGRLALRLDGFQTSNNTDLFVWLSRARRPRTTKEVVAMPHIEVGLLKSTIGSHNYLLPKGASPRLVKSVVIWCEPVRIAYTAAPMQ